MKICVITCDACGADLTDIPHHAEYGMKTPTETWFTVETVHACDTTCLVRIIASQCEACGVVLAPGDQAAETHAAWHQALARRCSGSAESS